MMTRTLHFRRIQADGVKVFYREGGSARTAPSRAIACHGFPDILVSISRTDFPRLFPIATRPGARTCQVSDSRRFPALAPLISIRSMPWHGTILAFHRRAPS